MWNLLLAMLSSRLTSTKTAFGFQSIAYAGLETGVKDPHILRVRSR